MPYPWAAARKALHYAKPSTPSTPGRGSYGLCSGPRRGEATRSIAIDTGAVSAGPPCLQSEAGRELSTT